MSVQNAQSSPASSAWALPQRGQKFPILPPRLTVARRLFRRIDSGSPKAILFVKLSKSSQPQYGAAELLTEHGRERWIQPRLPLPHWGLGNRTLTAALGNDPPPPDLPEDMPIRCERFPGGLLRHYYRAAA